jgi:hypothetical protein
MNGPSILIANWARVFLLHPLVDTKFTEAVAACRFAGLPEEILAYGAFENLGYGLLAAHELALRG